MGLYTTRDRLCVVQLCDEKGSTHVVHFPEAKYAAPNLRSLLLDHARVKIMHFARFDVAILQHYLQVDLQNIFCTKIASRLSRTYTEFHGLKDLCAELVGVKLSKQQQSSDWGALSLTNEQIEYAASDVLYLHQLREKLSVLLQRENRLKIAQSCFQFIPTRAKIDVMGWADKDIFAH